MIRVVKSLLVLSVGANALICALQNIANLDEARGALAYVMSGTGQETYKHTLFFYSSSPALAWSALTLVLAGEFAIAAQQRITLDERLPKLQTSLELGRRSPRQGFEPWDLS
jgi:hypothetical protein